MSTPNPTPLPEFTRAVVAISKARGIGQRDLATLAGIDEAQVSRFMRGIQSPSVFTIAEIIQVFEGTDRRELVTAYLHDIVRALGHQPAQYPIGDERAPALADIAGPGLAQTIETLIERGRANPGVLKGLEALESLSRPAPADPARRLQLSKKILPPRKQTKHRKAVG